MKNKQWYEWLLLIVYLAMVGLCVILNLTAGQGEGLANLIVNGCMFIIVAVMFASSEFGSFAPMNEINADLTRVTKKIRSDALNSHDYLWEPYSSSNEELFENPRLRELYKDYLFELNRTQGQNVYYKAGIEDYINTGLVDSVMHRNQLNQIPGALTGLGILGTFIGLTLGLQHFNTGSTAEITNSISPLMAGIKVAFHTSIYGMIFSLVYNYVYKRKLFESEEAVEEFTQAWRKFVVPDTSADGLNRIIELEEKQLKAIRNVGDRISEEVSKQLDPNFEKLGKLITDFTAVATADQRAALSTVVKEYIGEMNRSLSGSFTEIKKTVDETYVSQKNTAALISQFADSTLRAEDEIKKNIMSMSMQSENSRMIIAEEQKTLKDVVEACSDAADAADTLRAALDKMNAKSRR